MHPHSPGALCLERILQPSGSGRRPAASPDPESTRPAELGGSGWFSEGQAGSLLSGPSPGGFDPGGCRRREPTTFLHLLWPHALGDPSEFQLRPTTPPTRSRPHWPRPGLAHECKVLDPLHPRSKLKVRPLAGELPPRALWERTGRGERRLSSLFCC